MHLAICLPNILQIDVLANIVMCIFATWIFSYISKTSNVDVSVTLGVVVASISNAASYHFWDFDATLWSVYRFRKS
jgi:hypothetical protein